MTEPTNAGPPSLRAMPRRPARLGAVVVSELLDRIVSGQLPQRSLLPNEPTLCETFGVSRTVIREAVKVLEEKGLLHAKQGQGTTVAAYDDWNLLDPMVLAASVRHDRELRMLDDIVDVRRVLEAQMARQAATHATKDGLAEISALLGKLAGLVATPEAYILTDLDFHDAVMRASGNRLARAVVRTIHSEARASTRYNGHPRRSDCEASNAGHAAIYDRIAAGDPDGAARAMSEHILGSWQSRRVPGNDDVDSSSESVPGILAPWNASGPPANVRLRRIECLRAGAHRCVRWLAAARAACEPGATWRMNRGTFSPTTGARIPAPWPC